LKLDNNFQKTGK